MPKLDYITPLFAFDSNHLTTTTTKDCYLYGTFTFSGSTTNTQNITLTIGSISTVYKLNNGAQAPKATYSVETQLIPSGTTITITPSSASLLSDCNLYLLDVVDS